MPIGSKYFDTTLNNYYQYTSLGWFPTGTPGSVSFSGGALTSDATYYYRAFTSTGTLTVAASGLTIPATALLVGGGGSGRSCHSGGSNGGSGGATRQEAVSLTTGTFSFTVGTGGPGWTSSNPGLPTVAFGFTAAGGVNSTQTGNGANGTFYSAFSAFGASGYFGGGGGAGSAGGGDTGFLGGLGGGARGGNGGNFMNAPSGVPNTGGGGGGGNTSGGCNACGDGATGIVIVRYARADVGG
jgi:hypothetical protein